MSKPLILDQEFKDKKQAGEDLSNRDYEQCTFLNCDFSNADFTDSSFTECDFIGCDLSNVKVLGTGVRQCQFSDCKMVGIQWDMCSDFLFEMNCKSCKLDVSNFNGWKLKGSSFQDCSLIESDFTNADLEGVSILQCNLQDARFENTNLQKADLSGSLHFEIDPELNKIKGAIFSKEALQGLLHKYKIKVK